MSSLFVSYAHVDNQPVSGEKEGWISHFIHHLRGELNRRLGRAEHLDLWMDFRLEGNDELTPELEKQIGEAQTLLLFFSEGWRQSEWCRRELELFTRDPAKSHDGRIFLVELDGFKLEDKPAIAQDVKGFRFWETTIHDRIRRLGYPLPDPRWCGDPKPYFDELYNLADALANKLKQLQPPLYESHRGQPNRRAPHQIGKSVDGARLKLVDVEDWDSFLFQVLVKAVKSQVLRFPPDNKESVKDEIDRVVIQLDDANIKPPKAWKNGFNVVLDDNLTCWHERHAINTLCEWPKEYGFLRVKVALPIIMLASVAIFYRVQEKIQIIKAGGRDCKLSLDVQATYPHALDMLGRAKSEWKIIGFPDLLVMGDAPSLRMIEEELGGYKVRIPMPPCEQRILLPNIFKKESSKFPVYYLAKLDDTPSTPFAHTKRHDRKIRRLTDPRLRNIEPHAAIRQIINRPDLGGKYVFWSPHWQLLTELKIAINPPKIEDDWHGTILYANESICREPRIRYIEALIRGAWMDLRINEENIQQTVRRMMKDEDFRNTLDSVCCKEALSIFFKK